MNKIEEVENLIDRLNEFKIMSEAQLNKIAFGLAEKYYPKSGIDFGNKTTTQVLEELKKVKRSKTSLIKDIKSLQKKLGN